MRLWHYKLLKHLPKQWLLGQHRECCALRGKGWGRKHSTVDYVFKYPYYNLFKYHSMVMEILENQHNVKVDPDWKKYYYRGMFVGEDRSSFTQYQVYKFPYPEHNNSYLKECIKNLKRKGITVRCIQNNNSEKS